MLDAIVDYLPSPVDIPPIKGHAVNDEDSVIERNADPPRHSPRWPSRSCPISTSAS